MQRWHAARGARRAGSRCSQAIGATRARQRDAAPSATAPIKVGIVYSRTGLARRLRRASRSRGFRSGSRTRPRARTRSTAARSSCTFVDDTGDPAKAVTAAKDLIGQGYKILAGTGSSGVALQIAPLAAQNKVLFISGPAATDAITGINKYTFRSGRQTLPGRARREVVPRRRRGKKVVVFAQDTAFGHGNYAAVSR